MIRTNNVFRFRPVSKEEEMRLAVTFQQCTGKERADACKAIISNNIRWINKLAWLRAEESCNCEEDFENYRQEGIIALMGAIEKFDATRGVKLYTYAQHFVRKAIELCSEGLNDPDRKELKQRAEESEDSNDELEVLASKDSKGAETEAKPVLLNKELLRAIEEDLSEEERTVIYARLKHLKYKEISSKLGISLELTKKRIHTAKNKLKADGRLRDFYFL